ncbi:hypothetical protein EX30DRAFT_352418 [Ascodesmis nigricans]|uniref:Uncharacterized protein n=1 Tax=Ascodesmis nigricans TaxID=341454 RepID=A0A4S2MIJ4_9PEZI|nr:hypothetical protein EX30DRAFT_352418 [Ascodesmis nigricans]
MGILINHGAQKGLRDIYGRSLFLLFCLSPDEHCKPDIIRDYFDDNLKLDDTNKDGRTALHLARNPELVRRLCRVENVDLNARNLEKESHGSPYPALHRPGALSHLRPLPIGRENVGTGEDSMEERDNDDMMDDDPSADDKELEGAVAT